MKHEKLAKSYRILRILEFFPIFPPCFTKFRCFFSDIEKFMLFLESHFLQNVVTAKFEQRGGHRKLRNGCGKVMDKFVGTQVFETAVSYISCTYSDMGLNLFNHKPAFEYSTIWWQALELNENWMFLYNITLHK